MEQTINHCRDDHHQQKMVRRNENGSAELPQHIIHHILSLVPGGISTTELTRLGLVSKGWLHACCSYEIIDLCQTCSYNGAKSVEKSQSFFRSADKIMTRYRDTPIQKLRLHLDLQLPHRNYDIINDNNVVLAVDKWINIALDNHVQDLDLRLKVVSHHHDGHVHWEYPIPTRVMSSDLIKSLSLGYQVCLPIINNMDDHLCNLASLRSLEIFQVVAINNDVVFQRLIKACPAVQKLIIESEYLDEINVSGLHHLKMISITRYTDVEHWTRPATIKTFKVKIEAPGLETLWLSGFVPRVRQDMYVLNYYKASVHVDRCNLKHLKLTRDIGFNGDDDEQCHGFFSSFPKLENLELHDCSLSSLILDNNTMLKKVELKLSHLYDSNIDRIRISCHKHTHFLCETISPKKFPVILVDNNNCPGYVQVVLKGTSEMHIFPYWFRKIRETMASINSVDNYTSLSCNFTWKRESSEVNEMAPTHNLPASKIDSLTLAIAAPSRSYPVILSRFFSTLHPTTLQVSLADDKNGKDHDFLKFLCESLANRGNGQSCLACSSHIKCWRHHQLKEAKLECIKGPSETIYLDWSKMLKQLSTLTVGHYICFRLEWVE